MKMILTLATLVIIAMLVAKNLQQPPVETSGYQSAPAPGLPPVPPTQSEGLPQFEQDMNRFMNEAEQDQARQIENAVQ